MRWFRDDQRLSFRSVTAGSQIILPAYPTVYAVLGLFLIFQDPERTSAGAFETAKILLSIHEWGLLFVFIGILEFGAMAWGHRRTFITALIIGCAVAVTWAVLIFGSAWNTPTVSFTSAIWPMFVAVAHMASARSLARDTVMTVDDIKRQASP